MASVGAPNRSNLRGMARYREPIVDRRPDPSTLDGRLTGARMPGDEQDHPIPPLDCLIQPAVDC